MAGRRHYCFREVLPFAALVSVECSNVAMNTLYKAAVVNGLNFHVYMTYSYAVVAIVLLPLAYIFHRKTPLPPFTVILFAKFFVLGFLGFSGQYVGNLGIKYSSPTMASAMSNIAPASTFFLAIIFRMENVNLKNTSSKAKIIGAVVSISGALVVVLFNGPLLITHTTSPSSISISSSRIWSSRSGWIIGGALNAACYVIASTWYIFQGMFVREYPAELVLVFFQSLFSLVLSVPVGFLSEPRMASWKIPADIRLISIIYAGIMGSGYGILIHTWGLRVKGPVYVALFRPLSIGIAAVMGVIFLGDDLYLGTVIGSGVIAVGFYTVAWGKHKEERCMEEVITDIHTPNAPLLS